MRTNRVSNCTSNTRRTYSTYFHSSLDALEFHCFRLPDAIFLHVNEGTRVTIKTPCGVAFGMLGPHASQDTNRAGSCVLSQRPGNNLHSISDGLVRPLLNAFNRLRQLAQFDRNCHLDSTATRGQSWVEDDIPGNGHSILKVALNLVDNVLGRTTQKDGASLRVLAFSEEGEIFVADLLDFEQSTSRSYVRFLEVIDPVHDRRTSGTSDTVVIRLPHSAESCDVGLHQEVLCEVWTGGQ